MSTHSAVAGFTRVTELEARRYLDKAGNDELSAAIDLAFDRARRGGWKEAPDAIEIHHAFFLLRNARGLVAPSFDSMRVELRQRGARGFESSPALAA